MATNKLFRLLSTSALVASMSLPVMAQEITFGEFALDFDALSDGDDSVTATDFSGEIEYTYNQFLFGTALETQSVDGDFLDATVTSYQVSAGYMPLDEVLVGAELSGNRISSGGSDEDFSGYALFGQYVTDQYGVAIKYSRPDNDAPDEFNFLTYYGQVSVTPEVTVGALFETAEAYDESFYLLNAEYAAGPVGARVYYSSITDTDISIFGLRGSYEFGTSARGTLDLQLFDDGFDDATSFAIGGGYEFTDGFWVDASVGQISDDSDDVTSVTLGLTYEIGQRKRLDRQMTLDGFDDLDEGFFGIFPRFTDSFLVNFD